MYIGSLRPERVALVQAAYGTYIVPRWPADCRVTSACVLWCQHQGGGEFVADVEARKLWDDSIECAVGRIQRLLFASTFGG